VGIYFQLMLLSRLSMETMVVTIPMLFRHRRVLSERRQLPFTNATSVLHNPVDLIAAAPSFWGGHHLDESRADRGMSGIVLWSKYRRSSARGVWFFLQERKQSFWTS
jgi:hypothetical protein